MSESGAIDRTLFFPKGANESSPGPENVKSETLIIERVCSGDREAFGEFYRIFSGMVHGIVLARVPRDEVDDIVQEVFLRAYQNIRTLRDKKAVGGWLAMIARNCAAEFYRQMKPAGELKEDLGQTETRLFEAREILTAIRALPDTYQETLVLRLVEGMTGPEIADRTGHPAHFRHRPTELPYRSAFKQS